MVQRRCWLHGKTVLATETQVSTIHNHPHHPLLPASCCWSRLCAASVLPLRCLCAASVLLTLCRFFCSSLRQPATIPPQPSVLNTQLSEFARPFLGRQTNRLRIVYFFLDFLHLRTKTDGVGTDTRSGGLRSRGGTMTVHIDVFEHLPHGVTWTTDPRVQQGEKNTAIMGPPFSDL